jgi:hypothetical protein
MKKVSFFNLSLGFFGPRPLGYGILLIKIQIDVIASQCFSQSMFLPVDLLANRCFCQSMFLPVDVFASRCFRVKSRCFRSRCFRNRCYRTRSFWATRQKLTNLDLKHLHAFFRKTNQPKNCLIKML